MQLTLPSRWELEAVLDIVSMLKGPPEEKSVSEYTVVLLFGFFLSLS